MVSKVKTISLKYRLLLIAAVCAAAILWLIAAASSVYAVHTSWGHPAHNHIGNTVWSTGGSGGKLYGGSCATTGSSNTRSHIISELQWLSGKVPGYSYGSSGFTQAIRNFQSATGIQVDGCVGNQTLSSMEFEVFAVQSTYRLPAGIALRFPPYIYTSTCTQVTNNSSSDVFVPIRTSSEFNSFKWNPPSGVSTGNGDCSITSGGSSGGGGGSSGGGGGSGGSFEYCYRICQDYLGGCPASCTAAGCSNSECSSGGCVC